MIRFRSISIALFVAALAVSARAQGTTGGLLYASDFANWTLPQGNTPAQGAIFYPNQDICKVTSNGYTFLAPKVGRPITIVDGANTETVTPTNVVIGSIGCSISATMAHSHSSYFLKSGTGGAQEAVDYQASQPQGANVVLTPAWTAAGGTTGIITGTLKGNNGVTILDQRTAIITPYTWNGANYIPQPLGASNISGLTNGLIPLATSPTGITANSHLDDGVTTPATITASETLAGTGANFSGTVAAPSALVGALPGYKQNPIAMPHNRDQQTAIWATPQDFAGCANAGNGQTSDAECFRKAIRWLASFNVGAPKVLYVPWTAGGYYFSNNDVGYLATMPYDFGDYHGSAGYITQAAANCYFTAGQLTGCAISGGSGYAPSAQLPIQILDPTHRGSGAAAYVTTNASGVPASTATVQLAGMNYPQIGTFANVIPLGGDGATGTATLAGGTFTGTTITTGGSGYNDGTYGNLRQLVAVDAPGLTCAAYPKFTAVVTNAAVASVTVTTAGSGCTYTGSGTISVPLVFGASCGGVQCTLLPMQTPQNMPMAVALLSGVSIVGIGNPVIHTDWERQSKVAPTLTDVAAFGDPWGDQTGIARGDLTGSILNYSSNNNFIAGVTPPDVEGMTIKAQVDLWFAGGEVGGSFINDTFGGGLAFYAGSTMQQLNGNSSVYLPTLFDHDKFYGMAGILVGGDWKTRSPGGSWNNINLASAGGNFGGTYMGHFFGSTIGSLLWGSGGGITVSNSVAAFVNSSEATFDTFWETNLWKQSASLAAPYTDATHLLSNESTTCPTSLSYSSRATDDVWGYTGRQLTSYPWFNCFRGVRGSLVMAQPRYSNGDSTRGLDNATFRMSNITANLWWRPIYMGTSQTVDIQNFFGYQANATADPYIPGGGSNADIWLMNRQFAVAGQVKDIVGNKGFQSTWNGINGSSTNTTPLSKINLRNVVGATDQVVGAINNITLGTWPTWLTPTCTNCTAGRKPTDVTTLSVAGTTCAAGTLGACAPDGTSITAAGGVLSAVGGFTPLTLDFTRTAAASGIGCTGAAPGPYTCTAFPTGSHICTVYVISGGGGGGSGALEASGTNAFGGGGGAGAAAQFMVVPCSYFGGGNAATVTVTVGAGGTSGTAQSTNSTSGNAGGAGGASLISGATGSYASISTTAANAGAGGTTTTGTGGVAPTSVTFTGCVGAAGSSTTGGAAQCGAVNNGPGGGAGGGGVNTTPTAAAGGAQNGPSAQSLRSQNGINLTGGTLGGGNGQTPSWASGTPASATTFFLSALGGTGGGGNAAGNGGTGGSGMFPGGGGAGGGAALNGSSSGAGGVGGDGFIRVIVQ